MNVYKQVMVIEMFQFFFLVGFHMLSMLWSKVLFEKTGKRVVLISQAYRAGVIWRASSQYFLNENYGRHLWFYGKRRAGEKKKFIPRRRSTVENEKRCGGWRSEWYWPLPFTSCEWPRQNFSLLYLCNIMQTSDENKEKYQSWDYRLIRYQILQANTMRIVWQTVGRINYEILGVKGLREYIKEKIWWQRNLKPRALILYFA